MTAVFKNKAEVITRMKELEASFTEMNKAFIFAYLKTFNGARAARLAGCQVSNSYGYEQQAREWLHEPTIREYISLWMTTAQMEADEVLYRLALQARASVEDFYDIDPASGQPIMNLAKAEEAGALGLIKKLVPSRNGGWIIELHDQQAALVQIGKFHSLWGERIIVEDADESDTVERLEDRAERLAILLNAARARRDRQAPGHDGEPTLGS